MIKVTKKLPVKLPRILFYKRKCVKYVFFVWMDVDDTFYRFIRIEFISICIKLKWRYNEKYHWIGYKENRKIRQRNNEIFFKHERMIKYSEEYS